MGWSTFWNTVSHCPNTELCQKPFFSFLPYTYVVNTAMTIPHLPMSWWRHQMETFSALLAICAGNLPVPGEFPAQRPVTRSFDVFFDLHPNQLLGKHWWGWWFETPTCPLLRHRNVMDANFLYGLSRPREWKLCEWSWAWLECDWLKWWTWPWFQSFKIRFGGHTKLAISTAACGINLRARPMILFQQCVVPLMKFYTATLHHEYAHIQHFAVFCWSLAPVGFAHILCRDFTGIGSVSVAKS